MSCHHCMKEELDATLITGIYECPRCIEKYKGKTVVELVIEVEGLKYQKKENAELKKERDELLNFLSVTTYDECQELFVSDFPSSTKSVWGNSLVDCFKEFKKEQG